MRFFAIITLISAFLLAFGKTTEQKSVYSKKSIPEFIKVHQEDFKNSFTNSQTANFAWAVMTGEKQGISPKLLHECNKLDINLIFSHSGLQFGALFSLFIVLVNQLRHKKTIKTIHWIVLLLGLFLPFQSIKRIIFLRLLVKLKSVFKKTYPIEALFLVTFFISFLLGHFKESPFSFILSFLYIGTFISFRNNSKSILILGLLSSHLVFALFGGQEVSLLLIILNLPLLALFSMLLPYVFIYLFTLNFIPFNWIEIPMALFIKILHFESVLVHGTFFSASLMIILATWLVLLRKNKFLLLIALLAHSNLALSPSLFYY